MKVDKLFKVLVLGGAMLGCTSTGAPAARTGGEAQKQVSADDGEAASSSSSSSATSGALVEVQEAQGCGDPGIAESDEDLGDGVQVSW